MTEADYKDDPAGDAAAAAVLATCKQLGGRPSSSAMLDALEAAEDAYEQQQEQQRQQQQGVGAGSYVSTSITSISGVGDAEALPASPRQPDTPRKAAICEATRERIIQKIFEALQTNPRYASDRNVEGCLNCVGCDRRVAVGASLLVGCHLPPLHSRLTGSCGATLPPPCMQVWQRALPRCDVPCAGGGGCPVCTLPLQAGTCAGRWGGWGAEGALPRRRRTLMCLHNACRLLGCLFVVVAVCAALLERREVCSPTSVVPPPCPPEQVYLSAVANAVRLARTADSVDDIPRIAAGEPREVAEGAEGGGGRGWGRLCLAEPAPRIIFLQGASLPASHPPDAQQATPRGIPPPMSRACRDL